MYLLDSDICIFATKAHPRVHENMRRHRRSQLLVSVISEAELRYGTAKSDSPVRSLRSLEHLLGPLTVVEFTSADALVFGDLRASLEAEGKPIGPLDTLIAAQAIARDLTLVTNNEREFSRIRGLRLENWTR